MSKGSEIIKEVGKLIEQLTVEEYEKLYGEFFCNTNQPDYKKAWGMFRRWLNEQYMNDKEERLEGACPFCRKEAKNKADEILKKCK